MVEFSSHVWLPDGRRMVLLLWSQRHHLEHTVELPSALGRWRLTMLRYCQVRPKDGWRLDALIWWAFSTQPLRILCRNKLDADVFCSSWTCTDPIHPSSLTSLIPVQRCWGSGLVVALLLGLALPGCLFVGDSGHVDQRYGSRMEQWWAVAYPSLRPGPSTWGQSMVEDPGRSEHSSAVERSTEVMMPVPGIWMVCWHGDGLGCPFRKGLKDRSARRFHEGSMNLRCYRSSNWICETWWQWCSF